MLAWMNSISPAISLRFSPLPVERSSITRTRAPCSLKAEAMCEPIKPAPPVTRATPERGILAAYSDVFKTHLAHISGVIDIAKISDPRRAHRSANSVHVEGPELIPFSYKHKDLRSVRRFVFVISILDLRQNLPGLIAGDRVIRDYLSSPIQQSLNNFYRGSISHVVSLGLKS